jgi:phenylalanyl-tRNA synthetase beta chain
MIITRSWLNEFIDLSSVSNKKLYETFNSIGLEVDSLVEIDISDGVVIGKILSVEKHPDADKLNVCQIDIGSSTRQIVCGAANVVDAEYVAVATIGAVLPGNFEIKHAKLRGVESEGMVCASLELGLPDMGKGIMILDDSIGELEAGNKLGSYACMEDTIIELELTANRGDCLCINGVARDLSAALDIEMKPFKYKQKEKKQLGMARVSELKHVDEINADLRYKLATMDSIRRSFLVDLRLAMVNVEAKGKLDSILAYSTHATGVILRAYNSEVFKNQDDKISINVTANDKGTIEVHGNDKVCSIVGVSQQIEMKATDKTNTLLFEASYVHPDTLIESVCATSLPTDTLYYKTSRGSSTMLEFGMNHLSLHMHSHSELNCYEGSLDIQNDRDKETLVVSAEELSSIIGMEVNTAKVSTILKKLGFKVSSVGKDSLAVGIPVFRHDVEHIQDIAEEIVRMIGIDNIEAKPFSFSEKPRLNDTTDRYSAKKGFRNRAVGAGYYENVSYVFSDKKLLEKYAFLVTDDALDLANPIAEELNTLRSTVTVNLLIAAKRNISYSRKSIPLFEIGAVFGSKREQSEVISFIFSGQSEGENVRNAGKPSIIDFATFTQKISAVIGAFELAPCSYENKLIHPYQSADFIVDGKLCGFISKLHPTVQEDFGLPVTFIAELDFDILVPKHINAEPVSRFQGVHKDLSVVIDKSIGYFEVAKVLNGLDLEMLKDVYPVDIYEDESLGDKKSLTVRLLIQSMQRTLEEADIENTMSAIMSELENQCKAELR